MRIDAGLIIGVALEFIIMLYFANSTLQPKKNYYISATIAFVGYVILFILSLLNLIAVNIISFVIINFLIFIIGYRINLKTAIIRVAWLMLFMFVGESAVSYILKISFNLGFMINITTQQSMLITIGGKLIYFSAVYIMRRTVKGKDISLEKSSMLLALMPLVTVGCMIITYPLQFDNRMFIAIYVIAITLNLVTFGINELMISKKQKIRILEDENYKNCIELKEYKTLNEKYEHSRIMNHDFREHLNVLKTLISEDIQKAQEYVGKIEKECEDSKIEKYSDNNILNILLIRKKKECEENGIKLNITSTNPKLDFIDGMDTVAIFSNLINNAIEACSDSARKDIFIDLYTVNNAFSVIKVENYADKEPIVVEGMLRSGKDDGNSHGIGIKSINNSLSKYDGKMSWSYDKAKGMFRTVISINNSQINI